MQIPSFNLGSVGRLIMSDPQLEVRAWVLLVDVHSKVQMPSSGLGIYIRVINLRLNFEIELWNREEH